ncbi:MAG TPA: serine/threonine-protein kinase, partial [Gemmatimonadales bacterium]|nr:serine/threonine-protein kinase [Gemmatimonadales bacterium]
MPQTEQYRRVGKFELHEIIGEGAMGAVWRAYDSVIRRFVALKLLTRAGRSGDAQDRFMREARAAGALQHPNIVTVYDLGESDEQLFIAMELVDGRDLSSLIAVSEPLALERKLDIVIEVLQGLSYAHERGVIHRDVKPSNVRIASDGTVKIMDFGIARLQSADVTGSGAIVGTPTYMAPEQITNGAITPATDVFAVGCLLYELLGYHKPFEGETVHGVLYQVLTTDPKPLRTMAPSIPAALERVVGKALNKVPEERYETARQMQSALFSIRAALSGATDTTERLSLR